MSIGLCVGDVGIGKCGSTTSKASSNVVNTAIANAYYHIAFTCKSAINAGNSVTTQGYCNPGEEGYTNQAEADRDQLVKDKLQAQVCVDLASLGSEKTKLTGEELTCLCGQAGAGCTLDVNQDSLVTSQMSCTNTANVKTKLKNDFANNMMQKLTSDMKDIGGLFDGANQDAALSLANHISDSISEQDISDISSNVTASNSVKTGCGGITIGITQYSQFNGILTVLSQNTTVSDAMNKLKNIAAQSLQRKDEGFTGWLYGPMGIIFWIIVGIVGLAIIYLLFKYQPWKSFEGEATPAKAEEPKAKETNAAH